MPGKQRVFSREFKEAAVLRMLAKEQTVQALADELELWPKLLYHWRSQYQRTGIDGFQNSGRPRGGSSLRGPRSPGRPATALPRRGRARPAQDREDDVATARIAELEGKVGRQALELDFFAQALRHIEASRRQTDGRGSTASSP